MKNKENMEHTIIKLLKSQYVGYILQELRQQINR